MKRFETNITPIERVGRVVIGADGGWVAAESDPHARDRESSAVSVGTHTGYTGSVEKEVAR